MLHRMMTVLAGLALTASLSSPPKAAQPRQGLSAPDDYSLTVLIYTVMAGLHNAHVSGNYTVLRDLSSPQFRAANTAAKLGEIFAAQRKHKLNIAAALLYPPTLDTAAYVDAKGLLQIRGFFDTKPQRLVFKLSFARSPQAWQLFGINVTLKHSGAS